MIDRHPVPPALHFNETDFLMIWEAFREKQIASLPEPIRDHLDECFSCRQHALEICFFLDHTIETPVEEISRPIKPELQLLDHRITHRSKWLKIAAFAPVILGIYLLYESFHSTDTQRRQIPSSIPRQQTTLDKPAPSRLITAPDREGDMGAKKPDTPPINLMLDQMVGKTLRSVAIRIISPDSFVSSDHPILFSWEYTGEYPLIIKIITVDNRIIITETLDNNRFHCSRTLPKGIYYWKLETKLELLWVGKFQVR